MSESLAKVDNGDNVANTAADSIARRLYFGGAVFVLLFVLGLPMHDIGDIKKAGLCLVIVSCELQIGCSCIDRLGNVQGTSKEEVYTSEDEDESFDLNRFY